MSEPPANLSVRQLIEQALKHHQSGRVQDAEHLYRVALQREPDNVDALHLLGMLVAQVGHKKEGLELVERAISLAPREPRFHSSRGNILRMLGRFEEAATAQRQVLSIDPNDIGTYVNLGNALRDLGRRAEAVEAYKEAVRRKPDLAEAHSYLGNVLREMGRLPEALAACEKAAALKPDFAELISNLALALGDLGRREESIAAFHRALRLKPTYAEGYVNFSHVLREAGRLDEAISASRQAVALRPELAEAKINLANALIHQGRVEEAIAEYRAAVAQKPSLSGAHSNALLALHNRVQDPAEMLEEHRRWDQMHAAPLAGRVRPHENDRDPDRRLRIGYVSSDFRVHPVGRLLLPVLQSHDRAQVEVICYSQAGPVDDLTAAARAAVAHWHPIDGVNDNDLAELIRSHQIDLLIDLGGHTSGNRLLTFAQKPAPVQITWLGYPDTTGMTAMDYRITDAIADRPGESDGRHTEKLLRLDGCFLCLRIGDDPIAEAPRSKEFTFGCFNNFTKASPQVMRLWGRVLHEAPHARLLLKARGLATRGTAEFVRQTLASHGVPIERVELMSHVEYGPHLQTYGRIDAALDTFPYSGTATTCDALSMGVPAITLAGRTHVSRVSASLLTHAGISEWVAMDEDAYVRLAVEAAVGGVRSIEQRLALRDKVKKSPLCDETRFTRGLERAHRPMWQAWVGKTSN